ncbi:MAG TPA: low specificity L-threonine aldolase [Dongiaceae bacterium]|nr:low specificity L-threonine aldolase [Dongiaceae bacterium]
MKRTRQFASDNYSGICPEAWAALAAANAGHVTSYGDDEWTERAIRQIQDVFETDCEVFFVFNGTTANALALAALCQPYHSIFCHELSHLETAECAAPGFFSGGGQLLPLPGADGKLTPDVLAAAVARREDVHFSKPGALSLTQVTEVGTAYSADEVRALTDVAHRHGLRVQMDGARFANAVAALGGKPADLTWRAGVDVLSLGGTKNGLAVGEAVVFFDRALAQDFGYRRKQGGQLASKMRFLSAPWTGVLADGAWLRHAAHANAMATRLAAGLREIPHVHIAYPVQSNGVFVRLPALVEEQLHLRGWHFYTGVVTPDEARLMCSWDTTPEDVDAFVADVRELAAG